MISLKEKIIIFTMYLICISFCNNKETNINNTYKKDFKIRSYVIMPENLYGINFCEINLWNVIMTLNNQKKTYQCNQKCPSHKHEANIIDSIQSEYFIGNVLKQKFIVSVNYSFLHSYSSFILTITIDNQYYSELLNHLNSQFLPENASINLNDYNEISWYANPDSKIKTCISIITLSKRLKHEMYSKDSEKFCYLEIQTRGSKLP